MVKDGGPHPEPPSPIDSRPGDRDGAIDNPDLGVSGGFGGMGAGAGAAGVSGVTGGAAGAAGLGGAAGREDEETACELDASAGDEDSGALR